MQDSDGDPLPGVTIWASGGLSVTTAASGHDTFTGLVTGTYLLTPSLESYTFSPPTRTVSLPPDAAGQDFTGTLQVSHYSVSGRVTNSAGQPFAGVMIHASGGFSATTLASGTYTLTGLVSGTYTLTPTRSGYAFSPVTRTVSLPPNAAGQDFASLPVEIYLPIVRKPPPLYSVSGRVTDVGGSPLPGVTLRGSDRQTVVTDGNGEYRLTALLAGAYTLTPTLSGYIFSPMYSTVYLPPSRTNVDFTGGPLNFSITRLRIIQAAQTQDNTAPLVQNKPGVAEVKVSITTGGIYFIRDYLKVTLTALRDGAPLPGSVTLSPEDFYFAPDIEEYGGWLPDDWLWGQVTLVATADPDNAYLETNEADNTGQAVFTFDAVPDLDVVLVPINYTHTPTGQYYPAVLTETISAYTLGVYPIGNMSVAFRAPLSFTGNLSAGTDDWSRLLKDIRDIKAADGAPSSRIYYGSIPYADNEWHPLLGGMGYMGIRASIGLGYDYWEAGLIFTHEAGHNMGVGHTGCTPYDTEPGYPYPNGSIGQWGLDAAHWPGYMTWKDPDLFVDLMSYCIKWGYWVSDYVYIKLYDDQRIHGRPGILASPVDSLLIRARFDAQGSASLLPVYAFTGVPSQSPAWSDDTIELLDASGRVIAAYPVTVEQIADLPGPQGRSITAVIPHPGRPVASVRWVRSGQVLAARTLGRAGAGSVSAPEVSSSPGRLTVTWGAPATPALVRFTTDGKTWTTVGLDVLGGSLTLDPHSLPEGEARFEVILAE